MDTTNGSQPNIPWTDTDAGQRIQQRLHNEKTLQALDHLLERVSTLEEGVEKLNTLLERGPGMASMVTDMADDTYRKAQEHGVDLEERMRGALQLADKLTEPETVERLNQLMDLANRAPGLMAMMGDMADDEMRGLQQKGVDLQSVSEVFLAAGLAISEARQEKPRPMGLWSMIRAPKDPDRQVAIGFLMKFLKSFGSCCRRKLFE